MASDRERTHRSYRDHGFRLVRSALRDESHFGDSYWLYAWSHLEVMIGTDRGQPFLCIRETRNRPDEYHDNFYDFELIHQVLFGQALKVDSFEIVLQTFWNSLAMLTHRMQSEPEDLWQSVQLAGEARAKARFGFS